KNTNNLIIMAESNLWVLKTVEDADRAYRSIEGYADILDVKYMYDNDVPNHKQIKSGDKAIIIDKKKVLGLAVIGRIETAPGKKSRGRCPHPDCGSTNYEARKTKSPMYRCNKGHEFDEY